MRNDIMRTALVCLVTMAAPGGAPAIAATAFIPGNIVATHDDVLYEYTRAGVQVQVIPVPRPDTETSWVMDVVVEPSGLAHVQNLGTPPDPTRPSYLSTFDPLSGRWQHREAPLYISVSDGDGAQIDERLITKFWAISLLDFSVERIDVPGLPVGEIAVGWTGLLYALGSGSPRGGLRILDPNTFELLESYTLKDGGGSRLNARGIAVAPDGEMYVADLDGSVYVYDPMANFLRSRFTGSDRLHNIDMDENGSLIIGSDGEMILTDRSLARFDHIVIGPDLYHFTYVSFVPRPRPMLRKCIDKAGGCVARSPAVAGDPMTFDVSIENVTENPITSVVINDDLEALGATCGFSWTSGRCVWDPGSCPRVTDCTVTPQSPGAPATFDVNGDLDPGCRIDVTIEGEIMSTSDGTCCNVSTIDYVDGVGPMSGATRGACFDIVPPLDVVKTVLPATVVTGGTATFTIGLHNNSVLPVAAGSWTISDVLDGCFESLGSPSAPCDGTVFLCSGSGCATSSCVYGAGGLGIELTDLTLEADDGAAGGDDEVVLTLSAIAGSVPDDCTNQVSAIGASGTLTDAATIMIEEVRIALSKTADIATTEPGGAGSFTIDITNDGTADLTSCMLTDDVRAAGCMGMDLVRGCTATPPVALDCTTDVATGTFDLPGGATQTIVVNVIAGGDEGTCANTAFVECHDTTVSGSDELVIERGCDLNAVDIATAPVAPPRAGPWVYTLDCGGGLPGQLDPDLPEGRVAVPGDTPGVVVESADPGIAATMTLYQRSCGCAEVIQLYKSPPAGPGRMLVLDY